MNQLKVILIENETKNKNKKQKQNKKGSQIAPTFNTLTQATQALQSRVKLLVDYLEAVEKGKVKADETILRNIQTVCNRLPTMSSEQFKDDFFSVLVFCFLFFVFFFVITL